MRRVVLVHGWSGSPDNCWFPWLKKELRAKGFEVVIPAMPDPDRPIIKSWVSALKEAVGAPDEETILVGHSIGNQTIFRYLASLNTQVKIAGVVSVAGFFNLPNLSTQEEKDIAKPWLETPIDTEAVKRHAKRIIAIFSDNDPDVDLSDKELFENRLGAETIVEHNKGHFSDDASVTELPVALEAIVSLAR